MSTTTMNAEIPVKGYTVKELATFYGISAKTFRSWLEPHKNTIGQKTGWYYNALQVRTIFEKLGVPG
ncbi:MAG: DUF4248 domain-containing protein [Chitinophagaceae bacterium]|nr:DUF4248 domain-containing protein [Chitinophagaceae bacterium]